MIYVAGDRDRGPDPLEDELRHLDDSLAVCYARRDSVADFHGAGRLGDTVVEHNPTISAQLGRRGARGCEPHGPNPYVDADTFPGSSFDDANGATGPRAR